MSLAVAKPVIDGVAKYNRNVLIERFLKHVDTRGTCWNWCGAIRAMDYGLFVLDGKRFAAHRVSYQLFTGNLKDGLAIDHLCRNRSCVKPSHLEQVSVGENTLRGFGAAAINKRRTHCIRGHEFADRLSTQGRRYCRICSTTRMRTYRLQQNANS